MHRADAVEVERQRDRAAAERVSPGARSAGEKTICAMTFAGSARIVVDCATWQAPPRRCRQIDQRFHLHPFTNHDEMHAQGHAHHRLGRGRICAGRARAQLLDGLAGLWCVNVGYGRAEIIDAVTAQMRQLAFYPSFFNTTTEPAIRLAERLAQLAPRAAEPHDLLQLRLGSERDRAQDHPRLLEAARPAAADENPLAQFFLSRRHARHDEHDRPAGLHRAVRSAAAGLHPRARAARLRRGPGAAIPSPTESGASRRRRASSSAKARRRSRRCSSSRCRARAA